MVLILNTSIHPHVILEGEVLRLKEGTSTVETLLPAIDELLKRQKKAIKQIEVVAVCIGPGSFTGTRVALSTAFALVYALSCKLVKFDALELLGGDGAISCAGGFYVSCNAVKKFAAGLPTNIKFASFTFDNLGGKIDLVQKEIDFVAKKIEKKDFTLAKDCQPLYLQHSQAERELSNKISIKKCMAADIDALLRVEGECFEHDAFSASVFLSEIKNKNYFCAFDGDKMVGYIGLSLADGESELIKIACISAYRKMGIATRLFEFAVSELKAQTVFLEVNKNNAAAIRLYQKLGFSEVGERKNYYSSGNDALIMTNQLSN